MLKGLRSMMFFLDGLNDCLIDERGDNATRSIYCADVGEGRIIRHEPAVILAGLGLAGDRGKRLLQYRRAGNIRARVGAIHFHVFFYDNGNVNAMRHHPGQGWFSVSPSLSICPTITTRPFSRRCLSRSGVLGKEPSSSKMGTPARAGGGAERVGNEGLYFVQVHRVSPCSAECPGGGLGNLLVYVAGAGAEARWPQCGLDRPVLPTPIGSPF